LRFSLGFISALALNANIKVRNLWRLFALLPWTIPSIVAANTWRWILQSEYGLLNAFLRVIGFPQFAYSWLGDPLTALPSVLVAYAWSGYPFVMLMLLAGMQGIPNELYEAARIDGANTVKCFRYITIPSLKPIILIVFLLEIVSGFNSFDILFTMTGGGPGGASEILAVSTILIIAGIVCFIFYILASAKKRSS
jgi:multiple sugar transport system permease protein